MNVSIVLPFVSNSFTSNISVAQVNIVWCWIAFTYFPHYTRWHSLVVAFPQYPCEYNVYCLYAAFR